jgi:hypothetical protein
MPMPIAFTDDDSQQDGVFGNLHMFVSILAEA